jgi:hypothetical protein
VATASSLADTASPVIFIFFKLCLFLNLCNHTLLAVNGLVTFSSVDCFLNIREARTVLEGCHDNIFGEGLLKVCPTCKLKDHYLLIVHNCTFSIFTDFFYVQWLLFTFWGCTMLWRQEACLTRLSYFKRRMVSSVSVLNVILHNNNSNLLIDAIPFIAVFLGLYAASPLIVPLFEVFCDVHCWSWQVCPVIFARIRAVVWYLDFTCKPTSQCLW